MWQSHRALAQVRGRSAARHVPSYRLPMGGGDEVAAPSCAVAGHRDRRLPGVAGLTAGQVAPHAFVLVVRSGMLRGSGKVLTAEVVCSRCRRYFHVLPKTPTRSEASPTYHR
jgi:hypothetical protein